MTRRPLTTSTPPSTGRPGYRPWLDGLRALAIALVLVEHGAGNFGLNLGGTGVGVFFALSGYLITGLLVDEWDQARTISLRQFYWRRAARLMPALLLAVVVCNVLFAIAHSSWPIYASFAALTYMANYATVLYGNHLPGYGPMWSLAVEEHFYLVWPLVLLFALRRWGRRGLLTTSLVLCAAALGWRAVLFALDAPMRLLYVGSLERADALLFGCAAAVALRTGWRPGAWALPVGAGLVATYLVTFPWGWDVLGSTVCGVGGALVCAGLDTSAPRAVRWFLSHPVLVWVGVMSYGIYLWHGPLITLVTEAGLPQAWNAVAVAVAVGCAALSHRYLEVPVRSWARRVDVRDGASVRTAVTTGVGQEVRRLVSRR